MAQETIISAKEISIGYSKTKHSSRKCLYNNLSFELFSGELVCLLGANGVGKSTLLRTISGSQTTLSGDIYLKGKKTSAYKEKELSQLLGLVLTDKTSAGGLTVKELVELGRYPYTGFFGQLAKKDREIVEKAIADVGILHKIDSYVAELSDGELQKAMVAKTLAQECPIVILDEPTAFLDVKSCIEIINLLHKLAINQGKTILLSTHDIDLALHLADRLWLLSRENGLQYGVTEDIILSGKMDNFFDNDEIVFNQESGNFLPKPKGTKIVYLKAEKNLHYWTKNLLARYNIQTSIDKEDTLFEIEVHSPTSIHIKHNKDVNLSSFEELAKWLINNNI